MYQVTAPVTHFALDHYYYFQFAAWSCAFAPFRRNQEVEVEPEGHDRDTKRPYQSTIDKINSSFAKVFSARIML
jgi:hypothetical protein